MGQLSLRNTQVLLGLIGGLLEPLAMNSMAYGTHHFLQNSEAALLPPEEQAY